MTEPYQLIFGNCKEELKNIPDNSLDSCVTDPPYDLVSIVKRYGKEGSKNRTGNPQTQRLARGFMNQTWDGTGVAFDVEVWEEVYRVLKPGSYLLAFGGTRTNHRMVSAIEDAGFVIQDSIFAWVYSTGFPKAVNVGKAIDKDFFRTWVKSYRPRIGNKRWAIDRLFKRKKKDRRVAKWFELVTERYGEPVGKREVVAEVSQSGAKFAITQQLIDNGGFNDPDRDTYELTKASTEEAKLWEGWATSIAPAWEPICVAQKPIEGSIAANVMKYGVGALNIDECRIGGDSEEEGIKGRWPKNLILQHHPLCEKIGEEVVEKDGWVKSGANGSRGFQGTSTFRTREHNPDEIKARVGTHVVVDIYNCHEDCPCFQLDRQNNEVSRLFLNLPYECPLVYCPKPHRLERERDLHDNEAIRVNDGRLTDTDTPFQRGVTERKGIHPTKKPLSLMRYLTRLVTPRGGTVIDPFVGSGTTVQAAIREGFKAIGIEKHKPYFDIADKCCKGEVGRFKVGATRRGLFDS